VRAQDHVICPYTFLAHLVWSCASPFATRAASTRTDERPRSRSGNCTPMREAIPAVPRGAKRRRIYFLMSCYPCSISLIYMWCHILLMASKNGEGLACLVLSWERLQFVRHIGWILFAEIVQILEKVLLAEPLGHPVINPNFMVALVLVCLTNQCKIHSVCFRILWAIRKNKLRLVYLLNCSIACAIRPPKSIVR
jgi:hypothetical protein